MRVKTFNTFFTSEFERNISINCYHEPKLKCSHCIYNVKKFDLIVLGPSRFDVITMKLILHCF